MIIVKLLGGLGNQMFQYAFGKHLALKNNSSLLLDLSYYESQSLRKYELDAFLISEKTISKDLLNQLVYPNPPTIFIRLINKFFNKQLEYKIVSEASTSFDSSCLNLKGNVYLSGYWQSEKYFKSIEIQLREIFTFQHEKYEKTLFLKEILHSNSISIHIRRGDYVNDKATHAVHGLCDLAYYHNAINAIADKEINPVFFIFTDDVVWAKENLVIPFEHHFVSGNNLNNFEEMYLMSLCKHNIIANSSFSWWAAWLNPNQQKKIIAPKVWFADSAMNEKTIDLIPQAWIRI